MVKRFHQVKLKGKTQRAAAIYIVFDILEKDGKPLTNLPLMERKKVLKDSLREGEHVLLSDFMEEKGEAYFQLVLEKGLEGVMAKRKDSRYEEGMRTGSWLKIKKLRTCDCVIFGYTKGTNPEERLSAHCCLAFMIRMGNQFMLAKLEQASLRRRLEF